MYINYFKGGRPASNLFDTVTLRDYEKIGNSLAFMDLCWGENDIICKYKIHGDEVVTDFVNAKNKRMGYPLYGEFSAFEKLGFLKDFCIAGGGDELIRINSNRYEMMMPALRRLPQDIEEYLNLLSVDPRFLLHIQTDVLVAEYQNNSNLLNDINKIVELSVCRIISNHHADETDMGEELKVRDTYRREVLNLMKILERDLKRALRVSIRLTEKTAKIN